MSTSRQLEAADKRLEAYGARQQRIVDRCNLLYAGEIYTATIAGSALLDGGHEALEIARRELAEAQEKVAEHDRG